MRATHGVDAPCKSSMHSNLCASLDLRKQGYSPANHATLLSNLVQMGTQTH